MTLKHLIYMCLIVSACEPKKNQDEIVKLITLDPGHFHAALVQKTMYDNIDSNVYVYAGESSDLQDHLNRIDGYNQRNENPTHWNQIVYTGSDFFQKMLEERKGNVVVLAGNNQKKTEYIKASIDGGINVLSDKPMAINKEDFDLLRLAFESADQKGLILYDIMTERSEITTILQREFSLDKDLFGELEEGTPENPAVTKESIHHFYKFVSGAALKRPAWFFDVSRQGDGITDVTTHLVDLIQWECFPDQIIDYTTDIKIENARRWPTIISPSQFAEVTYMESYPDYLQKYLDDSLLNVFCNGEINYRIKGVHAKVSVIWNFKAPEGAGDTHFSIMRGTKANLIIKQGKEENYKPVLYVEPLGQGEDFNSNIYKTLNRIQNDYPGVTLKESPTLWEVIIPDKYKTGHEAHFAEVTERFLQYLKDGKLPEWEVPNMITKYYITTRALEMAMENEPLIYTD